MKLLTMLCLLAALAAGGCQSQPADLMACDVQVAVLEQVQKSVDAYNATLIAQGAAKQAEVVAALGRDIETIALAPATQPADAAALAERVKASLAGHLANLTEQERRRAELYNVTSDNIRFGTETAQQARQLMLYRSDISAQWKDYILSTGLKQITATKEATP